MKKLVLFDIDGTLIYHVGKHAPDNERFSHAFEKAWGIKDSIDWSSHEGWTNKGSAWDVVRNHGISREDFERHYPIYGQALLSYLKKKVIDGKVYEAIGDAKKLVSILLGRKDYSLGLLTGNTPALAYWKLFDAGYEDIFPFGVYGDESEDRSELARLVPNKAHKFFGVPYDNANTFVLGDTILDIQCGKAISAVTIAVTTGGHKHEKLKAEKPDLLVNSLMDKRVLDLLGLEQ